MSSRRYRASSLPGLSANRIFAGHSRREGLAMSRKPKERMRYHLAILVAGWGLCASAGPLAAQASFGVKGGLVSSTLKLTGEGSEEAEPFLKRRSGVTGGAFLALGSSSIGLQFEGIYVQKGVKVEGEFEGTPFTGKLNLAYIEVPALIRLSLPAGNVRPYVYAGGAAAFEMKCDGEFSTDGTPQSGDCEEAESQSDTDRRKLDFTVLGGGGVEVQLGRMAVLFEARYARGIRNLNKTGDSGAKNEALSFLAGLAFPLGSR